MDCLGSLKIPIHIFTEILSEVLTDSAIMVAFFSMTGFLCLACAKILYIEIKFMEEYTCDYICFKLFDDEPFCEKMTSATSSLALPMRTFLKNRLFGGKVMNKLKHYYERKQGEVLKESEMHQIRQILMEAYLHLSVFLTTSHIIEFDFKPYEVKAHLPWMEIERWNSKDQALMETRKSNWQILGNNQSELIERNMRNYMEKCYKHLADLFDQHAEEVYRIAQKVIAKKVITLEVMEKVVGKSKSLLRKSQSMNNEIMPKVSCITDTQWNFVIYYAIFSVFVMVFIYLKYFNIVHIPPLYFHVKTYADIITCWYPIVRCTFVRLVFLPHALNFVYNFFKYKFLARELLYLLRAGCDAVKSFFCYILNFRHFKTLTFPNRIFPSSSGFTQKY
nr:uncharacterized protein LOC107452124 isoform X2 [Parasteatoda tepidariorum]